MEQLKNFPFCDSTAVYCTNGYDGDLVTCSNDECNIADTSWEPSWWNTRADTERVDIAGLMRHLHLRLEPSRFQATIINTAIEEYFRQEKQGLVDKDELPPNHTVWFDNICAHRHEVGETWNLMYLTDEQAKVCYKALETLTPIEKIT